MGPRVATPGENLAPCRAPSREGALSIALDLYETRTAILGGLAIYNHSGMPFDPRLSLQKLEVFCLVVELGGVTRASHHLFVTQPVVSSHLHSLSEQVGTQLFVRQGNRLELTDAGSVVYDWAKEVLVRAKEVAREVEGFADAQVGSAVVYASMSVGSYLLPPILLDFLDRRPRARISLSVADPEVAIEASVRGECDFAVVMGEDPESSPIVDVTLLGYERLSLVAAPTSDVPDVITVADVCRIPFVCSPKHHLRRRVIDRSLYEIGVPDRHVTVELGHPEAMKTAVRRGAGVTFAFACSVQADIDAGSIREIQIVDTRLTAGVFLVRRATKRLNPLHESFIEFIRAQLAERLLSCPGDGTRGVRDS